MNKKGILEQLVSGKISIDETIKLLSKNQIEVIDDFARYDVLREARTGIPEIIYSETKAPSFVYQIAKKVLEKKQVVMLSKVECNLRI